MLDPTLDKIVVADISTMDDIRRVENAVKEAGFNPKDFIQYGLGGLLVARSKTRDAVSAGYKLTHTEDGPTGKLSNDIDKEPTPGILNIEIREDGRYIVQDDEEIQGKRLLKPVYENGKLLYGDDDIQAVTDARANLFETLNFLDLETKESETTKKIHEGVRERFLNKM
ncbi:TPA: hypothetical protein DCZ39_05705 [Patescibacteria group bacterium]|nr:hypothetical protein [Candidatus Gracilibacteria bacterium]